MNLVGNRDPDGQVAGLLALKESGALQFAVNESIRIVKSCKQILHELPESAERNMLSTMTSLLRTNKFYGALRELGMLS